MNVDVALLHLFVYFHPAIFNAFQSDRSFGPHFERTAEIECLEWKGYRSSNVFTLVESEKQTYTNTNTNKQQSVQMQVVKKNDLENGERIYLIVRVYRQNGFKKRNTKFQMV